MRTRRAPHERMKPQPKPQRYFGMQSPGKGKTPRPADVSDYALAKARRLTVEQFRRAGYEPLALEYEHSEFVTNPLIAFARYIDRSE